MIRLLEFILGNVWHFIGTLVLIGAIFEGIIEIIKAARRKRF